MKKNAIAHERTLKQSDFLPSHSTSLSQKCTCGKLVDSDAITPQVMHEAIQLHNYTGLSLQGGTSSVSSHSSVDETNEEKKRPEAFDNPTRTSAKEMGVRFAKNKAACVLPNSFAITMATHQNDETAATGLLQIEFKGRGKTRYPSGMQELFSFGKRQFNADDKVCDCDCMMYRQYLRGIAAKRLPGQSKYIPIS